MFTDKGRHSFESSTASNLLYFLRGSKHVYHLVLHIVCEVDELLLPVPVLVLVVEDGPEDPRVVWRKTDAVTARGPVGLLRLKYQTSFNLKLNLKFSKLVHLYY